MSLARNILRAAPDMSEEEDDVESEVTKTALLDSGNTTNADSLQGKLNVARRAFLLFIVFAGSGGLLYALKPEGTAGPNVVKSFAGGSNEARILGLVGIEEPKEDEVLAKWKALMADGNKSLQEAVKAKDQRKALGLFNRTLQDADASVAAATASSQYSARIASCFVNVDQALFKLAQGATAIDIAGGPDGTCTYDKVYKTPQSPAACAASIAGVVAYWGYAAQFISLAAGACSGTLTRDIACSADITGLVASIAQVAGAGSGVHATCTQFKATKKSVEDFKHIVQMQRADTMCALQSGEAVAFFMRAGLAINSAVYDCKDIGPGKDRKNLQCAADISGIIEAFSFAAHNIAAAVADCPYIMSTQPACAASIINLVSGISGITNAVTGIAAGNSCYKYPGEN